MNPDDFLKSLSDDLEKLRKLTADSKDDAVRQELVRELWDAGRGVRYYIRYFEERG
jgi:hypothetical protein